MTHSESCGHNEKRQPPVHIDLPFEKAVEGLLGVKPDRNDKASKTSGAATRGQRAKKKPGRKKK